MKEFEKEEAILDHILGNKSLTEFENEWKNAETILLQSNLKVNIDSIENIRNKLEQLNNDISYKKALIETANTNDNYAELRYILHKTKEDIKKYENKYNAAKIAYETLKLSYEELQSTFSPAVSDKIGEILSILTDNEHDSIRLSKELDITLNESDGFHSAQAYSGGTIDQIYLAFRLTIAKLISDEETLPVYLDEPFVQYDDSRLYKAFNYLCDYSKQNDSQIILTSCHDRIISDDFSKLLNIIYI